MKRRILVKLAGLILLIVAGILGTAWWESSVVKLKDYDYLPDVEELVEQQHYGEALAIAREIAELPGMPNQKVIKAMIPEIEEEQASYVRKSKDFVKGAITGQGDTGSMLGGSLVADVFVYGDLRDLSIEAWHKFNGDEVDEFVALLSTIGIAASAATLFPEPTSTATGATVQAGATTLKVLKKGDALSPQMVKSLRVLLDQAKSSKNLDAVNAILSDAGVIVKYAPDGSLIGVFKQVDDPKQLKAIAEWMKAAPERTVVSLQVGGKRAVRWINDGNGPGATATRVAIRKGKAGFTRFRFLSRPTKMIWKGDFSGIVRDIFMDNPSLRKWGGIVAFLLAPIGLYLVTPRFARKRTFAASRSFLKRRRTAAGTSCNGHA